MRRVAGKVTVARQQGLVVDELQYIDAIAVNYKGAPTCPSFRAPRSCLSERVVIVSQSHSMSPPSSLTVGRASGEIGVRQKCSALRIAQFVASSVDFVQRA
jgi:hypothetical protein